jgi:hypothetical protein
VWRRVRTGAAWAAAQQAQLPGVAEAVGFDPSPYREAFLNGQAR